jgi:arginine/lysine/ornithine decarboxylase
MKDGVEGPKRRRPLEATKDCVSAGFVSFYPPGIPILAPGELITDEVIRSIKRGQKAGLNVMGITQEGILIVD